MSRRLAVIFGAGVLFGLGLAVSGMTDPGRVVGFLDLAGAWDPALIFVMGGAVATLSLGLWVCRRRGAGRGWFGTTLPVADQEPVDRRLVVGAILFGVGWGLGGYCPGPGIAGLAAFRLESLVFVPAMAAGMWLARVGSGADSS